jgi:2-isopropylmalate synthase
MPKQPKVFTYDTTLRDGAQRKGISYSLDDKLKITRLLDEFGIHYIEGGWPGSNPKDAEYFEQAAKLNLKQAKVAAFGSTRRVNQDVATDMQVKALVDSKAQVITVVAKSWPLHVTEVLRTTLEENLAMIRDTVAYLKSHEREVVLDAEHFFDGYRADSQYAIECLKVAQEAGADWIALCDTNGGSLPSWISQVINDLKGHINIPLGIHAHNDAELAVANSIAAVEAGATMIQGTINGYGERCGNANLTSIIPTLSLKMGCEGIDEDALTGLTELSRAVCEIANLNPDPHWPYVGTAAFAHKGGIHVAAIERIAASYEHIPPDTVGNGREIVISELSGRGNVRMRAAELGLSVEGHEKEVLDAIKEMEGQGLSVESAEGTFELLIRRRLADYQAPFEILDLVVQSERRCGAHILCSQATVKMKVGGEIYHTVAESTGPVQAIDDAMRKALCEVYPQVNEVHLVDYKVRILDPESATAATTRVLVEAGYKEQRWNSVGCSQNIIDASGQALADSLELFLLRFLERGEVSDGD